MCTVLDCVSRYAYPHGQCRSVGVGGYLLGGGVNWLGTYNKYGYGAESVLQMRAVLASGAIADITPEATQVKRFGLEGKGSLWPLLGPIFTN